MFFSNLCYTRFNRKHIKRSVRVCHYQLQGGRPLSTARKLLAIGALWFFSLLVALIHGRPWHWLAFTALAFSWLGDAMLSTFKPIAHFARDPFLAGMVLFAAAQIFYILAAANSVINIEGIHMRLPGSIAGYEILPNVLPVYLLLGLFVWTLLVARGAKPVPLKIAALVYCMLVCAMGAYVFSASFTGYSFVWQLAAGGLLFILSDSAIAARTFRDRYQSVRHYKALVWGTYLPAQLFLQLGFARLH